VPPVAADSTPGTVSSGERKLVALVFADLSGFTALASSLDPEEVYAFIRPGLAAMQQIVEDHGGTVPHVMGDGFMAVFGVPTAHEDDAERAVRAALAVRDHARALNRGRSGIRFPDVHAGVNSGEVMVAPSSEPAGFSVLGDTVNVAARLADLARGGTVLVAEQTKRRTEHAIRFGP
jgi:class 3 adenylate cyclase